MSGRDIYFNNASHLNNYEEPYLCVDGLQRLTACLGFLQKEFKVFDTYYTEFDGVLPNNVSLICNINDLKTRKEVLNWYLEMNSGGTPHKKEELARVQGLFEEL